MMECFFLDDDEQYQTQCGEMFFTTKGRLIIHCTLCERKFQGYDSFEIHIKEHIPIFNDVQIDETEPPECAVELYESEFEESNEPIEMQSFEASIKKEKHVMEEALEEVEMTLSEIKKQSRLRLKSGRKIMQSAKQSKVNIANRKTIHLSNERSAASGSADKKPSNTSNDQIEIPSVVREVQSRTHPRSALTPAEERKHKCPVCEVAFKDRHNMIHHLKRHSDNKDHKCPECGKGFYTSTEVRVHMRSHRNDRPFLCNMCGRSYVSNSHLVEHLKRHSNQRNHKCEICQKAFFSKTQLMGHMVGHSSDRPFSCEVCAASFTRQKALKNHLKLHENKREFKCELCDSGFNQRAGLFSHMKTAHKGE